MFRTGFFACAFVALIPFMAHAQEPLQPEQVTVEAIPAGTPNSSSSISPSSTLSMAACASMTPTA